MKKELDEELCKKYPAIFADRHADMTVTCTLYGVKYLHANKCAGKLVKKSGVV